MGSGLRCGRQPADVLRLCYTMYQTQIVADVHQFPGHIACSALSNSEIVVPCFKNGAVVAVLDIDSEQFDAFDEIDRTNLEQLVSLL